MLTDLGATFGERVARARSAVGLRQRHLAQATSLSAPEMNDIEHGRKVGGNLAARKVYDLAAHLGLRMETLLGLPLLGGPIDIEGEWTLLLGEAANRYGWPLEDVQMLANIHFRGRRPAKVEDWWFIYESIRRTVIR